MSHRDTSVSIKRAINQALSQMRQAQSQPECFKEDAITVHCNQSGVSILTDVFKVYMLQVKVNRRNYNSYIVIYIT